MKRMKNYRGALLFAGALAIAGCSGTKGSDGAAGVNGNNGTDGTNGSNGVNGVPGKLSLVIDGVATVGTTSTLTFTIRPAVAVCPGSVCNDGLSNAVIGQKTFYAQQYNTATNTFDTAKNFSFGSIHFKGFTADGNGAQYTATKAGAPFAPETSTSAFVYAYVTTLSAAPAPTTGHYYLPGMVASAAKVYGSVAYTSTANVAGCEKCHGAPYSKHGYRQGRVAGLNDLVACKVCHTDQRVGTDAGWYVTADDPATFAAQGLTTTLAAKYAYTANIMNDVHNSHAFEFNYPQSMANCVTCHAGKLDLILTDANFKPTVCKSCHPVTGVGADPITGRFEAGRAPSLAFLWANSLYNHSTINGYTDNGDTVCNGSCHKTNSFAPTFATLHAGYNKSIYADAAGTKYSASRKAQVDGASFDYASFVATVNFSVVGVPSNAVVVPTVVASLYGYETKDFVVSGHGNSADGKRTLEWTTGSSSNGPRLTVAAGASPNTWVASIDLSSWGSQIAAKQIKRMEVGVLPTIGVDPTLAVSTTSNPAAIVTGVTQTIDVSQTAANALIDATNVYGKKIVDPAKCNACHDALGTTFHSPSYGSAGTVACRLCHTVLNASSHLEMQSRSIDSFVHAIHAMQVMDAKNVNLNDAVQALRYSEHVEGNYPNFAGPLNCESCHYAGTYNPPDQTRSLPSLVSLSATVAGRTGLGAFAAEITGPGARACGGCHRAFAINEADGPKLAAFVAHTNTFSSYVDPTLSVTSTAAYIQGMLGAAPAAPSVAGAEVEQCSICHPTAGLDHQTLFNGWSKGL